MTRYIIYDTGLYTPFQVLNVKRYDGVRPSSCMNSTLLIKQRALYLLYTLDKYTIWREHLFRRDSVFTIQGFTHRVKTKGFARR